MRSYLSTPPATASAVMRPKFLAQSHTISRKLSSSAPASLRAVYTSKNRTKRQLLQAACGKRPTAIPPVLVHQDRDLRRRRRRRLSSPSHNHVNHSSNKCQPALIHALTPVNPSIRRKRASSPARTRPPRPRARPSPTARLPSCPQKFLPNLTQSLAISRLTLLNLYVPLTLQSIGQRGDSYRLPAARIRLRFARCPCTKTAICAAAVNHPHHINCVNHSSNKYQPALIHALTPVNPSIRRTRRDTLPPSAKFFSESKETHEFTRQFAPLRATLILTARTDRIQSRASYEFMPRLDPLCASAPPAATTLAAFTQPPVSHDDGAQPSNPTDSGN